MTSADRWILPEGVDELLPEQARVAEKTRRDIVDLFATWGYQLVVPPLIEFTDSLLIGLGQDVELQSFRVTDQLSGKPMAVRADITPQVARIDAHSMHATGINRLCYAGSVLHTRPKTLLASRCPMQVGAEMYGDSSLQADIEVISLMLETLRAAGVGNLTLDLGHVDIYRVVVDELQRVNPGVDSDQLAQLFDAIQRKSQPDLQQIAPAIIADKKLRDLVYALPEFCGDQSVLQKARNALSGVGQQALDAIDQLETISAVIGKRFSDVDIYFDLAELRGFDYHTGVVFAAYADGYGHALANGGRYDHIGEVFGAARPATGFNADIKSLITVANGSGGTSPAGQSFIAAPNSDSDALWEKVCELRAQGEVVVFTDAGQPENCDRQLQQTDGAWVVVNT